MRRNRVCMEAGGEEAALDASVMTLYCKEVSEEDTLSASQEASRSLMEHKYGTIQDRISY